MESLFHKLGRLARVHWGLKFRTLSTIYRGVFAPTVAYAASGWADLCTKSDIRILKALQRRVLISLTGAYRTASWESLCVVAGVIPVDIVLQESRARYQFRSRQNAKIGNIDIPQDVDKGIAVARIRDEALSMWQANWHSSTKGRTTYAFFQDVRDRREWLVSHSMETDHWVSQVFTGHGDFRARLASLGLVEDDTCVCGIEADTVPHFLLRCPLFDAQRVALQERVPEDQWTWPEVAHFLVSDPEVFTVLAGYCSECLWLKSFETNQVDSQ